MMLRFNCFRIFLFGVLAASCSLIANPLSCIAFYSQAVTVPLAQKIAAQIEANPHSYPEFLITEALKKEILDVTTDYQGVFENISAEGKLNSIKLSLNTIPEVIARFDKISTKLSKALLKENENKKSISELSTELATCQKNFNSCQANIHLSLEQAKKNIVNANSLSVHLETKASEIENLLHSQTGVFSELPPAVVNSLTVAKGHFSTVLRSYKATIDAAVLHFTEFENQLRALIPEMGRVELDLALLQSRGAKIEGALELTTPVEIQRVTPETILPDIAKFADESIMHRAFGKLTRKRPLMERERQKFVESQKSLIGFWNRPEINVSLAEITKFVEARHGPIKGYKDFLEISFRRDPATGESRYRRRFSPEEYLFYIYNLPTFMSKFFETNLHQKANFDGDLLITLVNSPDLLLNRSLNENEYLALMKSYDSLIQFIEKIEGFYSGIGMNLIGNPVALRSKQQLENVRSKNSADVKIWMDILRKRQESLIFAKRKQNDELGFGLVNSTDFRQRAEIYSNPKLKELVENKDGLYEDIHLYEIFKFVKRERVSRLDLVYLLGYFQKTNNESLHFTESSFVKEFTKGFVPAPYGSIPVSREISITVAAFKRISDWSYFSSIQKQTIIDLFKDILNRSISLNNSHNNPFYTFGNTPEIKSVFDSLIADILSK